MERDETLTLPIMAVEACMEVWVCDCYMCAMIQHLPFPPSICPLAAYDYRYSGGAGDYMRPESYGYPYTGAYPDRTAAYAYANYAGRGGYDMQSAAAAAAYGEFEGCGLNFMTSCTHYSAGMYSANGMGATGYAQSSSTYGPSRSSGYSQMGGADYGKDRSTTSRTYHPYRRTQ